MANVSTTRRTAKEWARLVSEWRRSGESAGAFGRTRGIPEATLRWWAWHLGRTTTTKTAKMPLVPVRVIGDNDRNSVERASTGPMWTLRTARGELHAYRDGSDVRAVGGQGFQRLSDDEATRS